MALPIIQEVSDAHFIWIFPQAIKVSTYCATTKIKVLKVRFLKEVSPGCEFRTNNEGEGEYLTLPKTKPFKLKSIGLDELHKLIKKEEHLDPIHSEYQED